MMRTPNFDRLAPLYRWIEYLSFGPWLALTRRTYLRELRTCRRALVIGDGDGRFTAHLLRVNASVLVDAVDASEAMLGCLLRRAGKEQGRVRVFKMDARNWDAEKPELSYDLVGTHFFLDCLTTEEAGMLAAKLHGCAAPGARWVVSEFALPAGAIRRTAAKALISFLYWCFGWMTGLKVRDLPDYERVLRATGWSRDRMRRRLGGLLVAELWSATKVEGG